MFRGSVGVAVVFGVGLASPAHAGPDVYAYGAGSLSSTVSAPQTVSPATGLFPATAGATQIAVDDATAYPTGTLVLLHQTTVAGYTPVYANPDGIDVSGNGVSHYELARIAGRSGNLLFLDAPLEHAYTAGAQVVRVEEYGALTVEGGGVLQADAFDGARGGILAVFVDGPLVVDGALDMSGRGFPGGGPDPVGGFFTSCNASSDHSSASARGGGAGGVGDAGVGSLANGGGGGNCGNTGGAGGGSWGVGGRGGWGHYDDPVGGWGGGFARGDWKDVLTFGGGGGSGDDNSGATDGEGAAGGGLIWVRARTITGSGSFLATGDSAADNTLDGAGGGGAGGAVILQSTEPASCGLIDVRGGNGGSTFDPSYSGINGPGGGGGGGRIVHEGLDPLCDAVHIAGARGTAFDGDSASVGGRGAGQGGAGDLLAESAPVWADTDGDGVVAGPNGGPDCDDTNPNVFPGAGDATCDGVDDDCDGAIDENTTTLTVFPDVDGDGFGAPLGGVLDCGVPSGFANNPSDCDDGDPDVNPGADEVCNGIDDDCDFGIDEGLVQSWYADDDGDGFGDFFSVSVTCDPPPGAVPNPTDCDDQDDTRFPGAPELCDGLDNDCDFAVDEDQIDQPWYRDADADGFGDASTAVVACAPPAGYVDDAQDCNDQVGVINPDATELCNGLDDDCDGSVDEGGPAASTWYLDADGDGRGDSGTATESCSAPTGHVLDGGDCDDTDPTVAPGLLEVCDGVDNDCDGQADDADPDVTQQPSWYVDGDADGVGDGPPTVACTAPSGSVDVTGDCDDTDPTILPGADEICDSLDNDCDGLVDDADQLAQGAVWYVDGDGDGVGGTVQDTSTCNGGPGLSLFTDDCDDADPDVFPGAPEPCEGIDTNCDGLVEGSAVYADGDGDGYGDPASLDWTCDGTGVDNDGDCDDTNAAINPDAVDLPGDGVDQDCDGADGVDTAEPVDTALSDTAADPFVPTGDTSEPPAGPVQTRRTGCGCANTPPSPVFAAVALLGVLAVRRRS
jgi:hypothetical protein